MHSEKVPYFILDLLQQVPFVYVPGLGRFDAIFHPAVVDIHQSQIRPPHIEPGFEVESHDAKEILPSYMHYVCGISKEDARLAINGFVDVVNQQVNSGGPYTIEKFGTFSRSGSDILHFTPDWDAFNLSFSGLEVLNIHIPSDTKTPETDSRSEDITPEPTPSLTERAYEATTESSWVTDQENPVPEIIEIAPPQPSQGISDSTSRLAWIILVSALTLITILCAYLAWDIISNRKKINQLTASTIDSVGSTSPDIIIIDTLEFEEEEIPVDSPKMTEPEPVSPVTENDEKRCYIVVGAFSNNDNVRRMESRLNELGYEVEKISGGSLTRVAISTSCDQETMNKTLVEARSTINPEAWIY